MTYDVRAIANFVLDYADQRRRRLTNMTINKIVYFLHAEYLAKTGRPLVSAKIEAWQYGPVFRELYSEFKKFGGEPIDGRATAMNPTTLVRETSIASFDSEDAALLEELTEHYSKMSASALVDLSHVSGGPWHQVYAGQDGELVPGMRIADNRIRDFFAKQTRH